MPVLTLRADVDASPCELLSVDHAAFPATKTKTATASSPLLILLWVANKVRLKHSCSAIKPLQLPPLLLWTLFLTWPSIRSAAGLEGLMQLWSPNGHAHHLVSAVARDLTGSFLVRVLAHLRASRSSLQHSVFVPASHSACAHYTVC